MLISVHQCHNEPNAPFISHSEQTAGGFLAPGKAAFLKTKTHYVTHPPPHPPPPIHICLTHFLSMHGGSFLG